MSMFSFFRRQRGVSIRQVGTSATAKAKLLVEALEDRFLPSAAGMRGILFGATFNPGFSDAGQAPIASAPVESRDARVNVLANGAVAPALGKIQLFGIDTTPYIDPRLLVLNDVDRIVPASISGYVYFDANNNGSKDSGETGIAGSAITLTGTSDQGQVSQTGTTDASGSYQFTDLRPGTYTLLQGDPPGWLDGKDTAGSVGGSVTNDQIAGIDLPSGGDSTSNNFGELKASSLSGFVYVDANSDGTKDPAEAGIPGVAINLTGFDDQGPIAQQASTDATGYYQFQNLRPGTYVLAETQPANYLDGKDTIGSQGGSAANDTFGNIVLAAGVPGINNNFGEQANADLGIVKTVSAASASVGSTLTYTLTVTNHSPLVAQNVQVLDALPPGAIYQSAAGADWALSQAGGTVAATLPSLDAGASSQISVTVKAPAVPGTLTNTATVSATTPDNNLTNNSSAATTTVVDLPGTTSAQDIVPLVTRLGRLPALGKIQLFGIDTTSYLDPALFSQLTS